MAMVGRKKQASSPGGIFDRMTNLLAKLPQVSVRRNSAAESLRITVSRCRAELAESVDAGHTRIVVRRSMAPIRTAKDEFARYLAGGFERDRLNTAFEAFVTYADRTFGPKPAGMMTWFTEEGGGPNAGPTTPEGAARHEAKLRAEAVGFYDALLKSAPNRSA
jgi:hypothetical protein